MSSSENWAAAADVVAVDETTAVAALDKGLTKVNAEPGEPPKIIVVTPFGMNRFILLFLLIIQVTCAGPHIFNWTPWEEMLKRGGIYADRCPDGLLEVCSARQQAIASLLSLSTLAMFCSTFIAGFVLDIAGPKICCLFGSTLIMLGWVMLSLAPKYSGFTAPGFMFVGAGMDPSFFGTLTAATLFPGYSSTIIAVLGAARSISNALPVIFNGLTSKYEGFTFQAVAFTFLAISFCCVLLFSVFFVPFNPYKNISIEVEETTRPAGAAGPMRGKVTGGSLEVPQHPPQFVASASNVEDEADFRAVLDAGNESQEFVNPMNNAAIATAGPATGAVVKSSKTVRLTAAQVGKAISSYALGTWQRLRMQLAKLSVEMRSPLYYPVVVIAIVNMIRNNFYLSSASVQMSDRGMNMLTLFNVLSFLPGPFLGLVVDRLGPIFVIAIINLTNTIMFVLILLAQLTNRQQTSDAFAITSIIFAWPGIGFLLSQIYCYVAVVFPPEDMGKLVGLASMIAGVCGLVVPPMYNWALNNDGFWIMDTVIIGLTALVFVIIAALWILMRRHRAACEARQCAAAELAAAGDSNSSDDDLYVPAMCEYGNANRVREAESLTKDASNLDATEPSAVITSASKADAVDLMGHTPLIRLVTASAEVANAALERQISHQSP